MKITKSQALEILKEKGVPAKFRNEVLGALKWDIEYFGNHSAHMYNKLDVEEAANEFKIPEVVWEYDTRGILLETIVEEQINWEYQNTDIETVRIEKGEKILIKGFEEDGKLLIESWETGVRVVADPSQLQKKSWRK